MADLAQQPTRAPAPAATAAPQPTQEAATGGALSDLLAELQSGDPDPDAVAALAARLSPSEEALVMRDRELRGQLAAAMPEQAANEGLVGRLDEASERGGITGRIAGAAASLGKTAMGTMSIEALEAMPPKERLALRLDHGRLREWADWHGPTGFMGVCNRLGVLFPLEFTELCIEIGRVDFLGHPALQAMLINISPRDARELYDDPAIVAIVMGMLRLTPAQMPFSFDSDVMIALCQDPIFLAWTQRGLKSMPDSFIEAEGWRSMVLRGEPPIAGTRYESQRDNAGGEGDGRFVEGDVMCNVTSLSMTLTTMAGDPARAKVAIAQLMDAEGVAGAAEILASARSELEGNKPEKTWQLEDLCLRFMYEGLAAADWKAASEARPELFPRMSKAKGWYDHTMAYYENNPPWHKLQVCLAYVALLCEDFVGSVTTGSGADAGTKEALGLWDEMQAAIDAGGSVVMSTNLTSSGHVVELVEYTGDGVILNDPYGFVLERQGQYVRNGEATKSKRATRLKEMTDAVLSQRLSCNSATRGLFVGDARNAFKDVPFPTNLGERTFYTMAEVKAFNIGKWHFVAHAGQEGAVKNGGEAEA